jgi:hypothetical protein
MTTKTMIVIVLLMVIILMYVIFTAGFPHTDEPQEEHRHYYWEPTPFIEDKEKEGYDLRDMPSSQSEGTLVNRRADILADWIENMEAPLSTGEALFPVLDVNFEDVYLMRYLRIVSICDIGPNEDPAITERITAHNQNQLRIAYCSLDGNCIWYGESPCQHHIELCRNEGSISGQCDSGKYTFNSGIINSVDVGHPDHYYNFMFSLFDPKEYTTLERDVQVSLVHPGCEPQFVQCDKISGLLRTLYFDSKNHRLVRIELKEENFPLEQFNSQSIIISKEQINRKVNLSIWLLQYHSFGIESNSSETVVLPMMVVVRYRIGEKFLEHILRIDPESVTLAR